MTALPFSLHRTRRNPPKSRYYLRACDLFELTGAVEIEQQAAWLSARGFPHRIGLRGMPIVRIADYVAHLGDTVDRPADVSEQLESIAALFGAEQSGLVYVIDEGSDDSPVKIGWSYDGVDARLASLQIGNPRALRLVCAKPGAFDVEQCIHRALRESRLAGEWFARTAETRRFLIIAATCNYRAALECHATESAPKGHQDER